ncbi:hypothetical protein MesoLjLc_76140 [Mesorhizobium sp. L-8-10]|nr:hypothetical protein MesoLjLb_75220 [Mesorhizobium sp. L-8-3]BCH35684.1 hypothetical protein MesoLjLc_76140 [Mesorhizobium sp. L-8-10]
MDAQPRVLRGQFGMVAAAGAAGVGEDQDALLVVHESGGRGEIGRAGPVLDPEDAMLKTAACSRFSKYL